LNRSMEAAPIFDLPQVPAISPLDCWVQFCRLFSGRPTTSLNIVPQFLEKEQAAHLLPAVPGRAVEWSEKDSRIKFSHRLFRRVKPVDRKRFLRQPVRIESHNSLAFLFEQQSSRSSASDYYYVFAFPFNIIQSRRCCGEQFHDWLST
jgi:hypothetical protein